MTSVELVTVGSKLSEGDARQQALAELNNAAENASTPQEAAEVMAKGKAVAAILEQMRAPFEETRLAGKASVVAARRLGRMLAGLSPNATLIGGTKPPTWLRSERRTAIEACGMSRNLAPYLLRLASIDDASFQRYIQRTDVIPSLHGALDSVGVNRRRDLDDEFRRRNRTRLRTKVGVKRPSVPSLDEAHSLILKALGHLDEPAHGKSNSARADIREATRHLYAAEDLLKKYVGGYV